MRTSPQICIHDIHFVWWYRWWLTIKYWPVIRWFLPKYVDTSGYATQWIFLKDMRNIEDHRYVMDQIARQLTDCFRDRGMLITIDWMDHAECPENIFREKGRFHVNVTLPSQRFADKWKKLTDRYTAEK